jgi:hypothetical protein
MNNNNNNQNLELIIIIILILIISYVLYLIIKKILNCINLDNE